MKQRFLKLSALCIAASAVLFTSCNGDAPKTEAASSFSLDSVKTAIATSNKIFGDCFAKGDSTTFVSCYTSDACINPSNMPRMCGPQAISAFFNGGYKMGIRHIAITTEELIGGKEAVAEIGKYELHDSAGKALDKGKFIVVWKEENGKWKMHRDVWNSDLPLPAAEPAKK